MVKLFGEVGGGVPEYFSSEKFSIKDVVKSYHEKTVLKHYSWSLVDSSYLKDIMRCNLVFNAIHLTL